METEGTSSINNDKVKKALQWMSEIIMAHPEKKRDQVLREAEVRFDLSPAECTFLDKNFSTP